MVLIGLRLLLSQYFWYNYVVIKLGEVQVKLMVKLNELCFYHLLYDECGEYKPL